MKLRAVGGHTVRNQEQLDAGVSVNMFPELGKQENAFQSRPALSQLSTHGYRDFLQHRRRPPVTGMTGSLERDERLVVVFGDLLRVYNDPDFSRERSDIDIVGGGGSRGGQVWSVVGAGHVGQIFYWARDDGSVQMYDSAAAQPEAVQAIPPRPRNLGLAVLRDDVQTPTRAARLFATTVADRTVRCYEWTNGVYERNTDHDLPLDETLITAPESLWLDVDGQHLLVIDAIGGRIVEFAYDRAASTNPWTRTTVGGLANPLDLQRTAGFEDSREPFVPGGIWADASTIKVIRRNDSKQVTLDRHTGVVTSIDDLPDFTDGDPAPAPRHVCGAVSGFAELFWYVNGAQYQDNLSRSFLEDGSKPVPAIPDLEDADVADPTPANLIPLSEDGRHVAWVVDRRLHLLDLERDRLITNVEGAVDSAAFATGRLVAADATTGRLKVSPVNAVTITQERYGTPESNGAVRMPGWPRNSPMAVTSAYVTARNVLGVAGGGLWVWSRADVDAPPVNIAPDHSVLAVCAAGNQTAVVQSLTGAANITVRLYDVPPVTAAEFNDTSNFTFNNVNLGAAPDAKTAVTAWACDGTRLFAMHYRTAPGQFTGLRVLRLGGAAISGFQIAPGDGRFFPGLTLVEGEQALRGIDWVNGVLLMAVKQAAPSATAIRAFRLTATGWETARALDLTSSAGDENRFITHDALFVYDGEDTQEDDALADGTPVKSTVLAAFRGIPKDRTSKYAWDRTRSERTGAVAVASVRRQLYVWTSTGMEIRDLADVTQGFPYALTATRTIGIVAPNSIAVVADVLHWLGTTAGGGLRVWRVGHSGDEIPDPIESKSIEEMLARMAGDPNVGIENAIGFGDDSGGHPTYVLHVAGGGISMAYDAEADAWHCRSSLRATGDTPMTWPWLDASQGVQRVTHSATWRGRLILGGYTTSFFGELAFVDPNDWRDIDEGAVTRVRQFSGGEAERRRIRYPMLRIDAIYGLGGGSTPESILPRFRLKVSDDGGRNFRTVGTRELGPKGGTEPTPFYSLGSSRERVYRVESEAPVGFTLRGAYQEEAAPLVSRKG